MVDARQKGSRAESDVKKFLIEKTGLPWERVPGSGALDEKHKLKGDIYLPDCKNFYCIEVKHYKDSHITHHLLSSKNPQILEWWQQCTRQAIQTGRKPLLIFKHDRSKLYCAFEDFPNGDNYNMLFIRTNGKEFYIALLEEWLINEAPKFTT